MINKYEIRKEQTEEVLYIHLNFDYEFSKMNFLNNINDYLKQKKIKFNGKKIVFMVSGIAFATLLLTNPISIKEDNKIEQKYVSSIILKDFDINLNEISEKEYEVKIEEENEDQKIKEETKKEAKEETTTKKDANNSNTNNKNNSSTNRTSTTTKTETTKNEETTSKNTTTTTKKDTTSSKEEKQNNDETYITVYRTNGNVIKLELEEYVIGVVAAELPASFNIETLKAQSILARTYALKAIQTNKKLTDNESTQTYKDNSELKSMWDSSYNTYYNKVKKAVNETKGMTIKYNNNYIEAIYHSTSNGYTEDSQNVWGNYYPYLTTVESPYDKNVSSYLKKVTFTYDEISTKLGITVTNSSNITYERNQSNRVSTITIDKTSYKGTTFRTKLGLRSTDFELTLNKNNIVITTKGYGHGVGMSQYGANEMAKQGYTYKQIINHYYKGVTISK